MPTRTPRAPRTVAAPVQPLFSHAEEGATTSTRKVTPRRTAAKSATTKAAPVSAAKTAAKTTPSKRTPARAKAAQQPVEVAEVVAEPTPVVVLPAARKERRAPQPVTSRKPVKGAWEIALELAGGNARRLVVRDDGSVYVRNKA